MRLTDTRPCMDRLLLKCTTASFPPPSEPLAQHPCSIDKMSSSPINYVGVAFGTQVEGKIGVPSSRWLTIRPDTTSCWALGTYFFNANDIDATLSTRWLYSTSPGCTRFIADLRTGRSYSARTRRGGREHYPAYGACGKLWREMDVRGGSRPTDDMTTTYTFPIRLLVYWSQLAVDDATWFSGVGT
ncbi:uncharacterized protein ARMOST_19884 [Armillaria ostoyae]|uniref:Uncharacterized protein n=1 Tax=Armillaria ostoyae TaxID=47428 RepID=A0A284S5T0_ARMOS|nr:uncharacterized protein ARMOST_19884 [Armillaria ostoyae]